MNKLAVVITSPPHSNMTTTALDYIETALTIGVNVVGVFFYQAGVIHGNKFVDIASDEHQAILKWTKLHNEYQLPLYLCATAAEKYGICCNQTDAEDKTSCNLNEIFSVSGLGELVELSSKANRMVQF